MMATTRALRTPATTKTRINALELLRLTHKELQPHPHLSEDLAPLSGGFADGELDHRRVLLALQELRDRVASGAHGVLRISCQVQAELQPSRPGIHEGEDEALPK